MFVRLENLPEEGVELQEPIDMTVRLKDYLEIQSVPVCRISGAIRPLGGARFLFEGVLSLEVEAICCRCLTVFPIAAKRPFRLRLLPASENDRLGPEEREMSTDMLDVGYYRAEGIDLDQVAEEQMNLLLPMRMLCKADCRGLCRKCGANLNTTVCDCPKDDIDPRFEILKKLR
jgi:uncharacterized protein